ncbi:MAG TPA: SHOCT domain-containing protein [Tepidisphaeraceae bacterium]|nr:SHOCT domain-containing protein [Tepidisphaeraceae bacterium]
MPTLLPVSYLAQAASVVGWSLVVIVLVVVGFGLISWVRKWMKEDDLPSGGTGFGLSELRQMHARGELTDAEYERARTKMTASAKAVTANMPDPAGGRRAPGAAPRLGPGAGPGATGFNPKRPRP